MNTSVARRFGAPEKRRRRWAVALICGLLGLGLVLGGFYAWRTWASVSAISRNPELLPLADAGGAAAPAGAADAADPPRPAPDASEPGSLTYLLIGSDARNEDERGRSDVLMLAHLTPARDRLYLISFPRDLWVDIPGYGEAKINAAFAHGGGALAVRTVEGLVGVRTDHVVMIDFDGFAGLTEALGGVTVDNTIASSSRGYSWPAGPITLRGDEALAYVRQRYELPHGDLDRAARQRAVVTAALDQLFSSGTLANPSRFNDVAGLLGQYVTVDAGLTNSELLATAMSLRLGGATDIVSLQAPVSGLGTSADGQSIVVMDEAGMADLARAIQTESLDAYLAARA